MNTKLADLENRLWEAADELRANSKLKSSDYSIPVLGLIFLKFADNKFQQTEEELAKKFSSGRRSPSKEDYLARCIYLPEKARFQTLVDLPEGKDFGKAVNNAMKAIEAENEDLQGVLPRTYTKLGNESLIELVRIFNGIPTDMEGDAFGKIYEYFLGNFAMSEGQKGGEFFTPTSVVQLIVEIIEPFEGKIFDPASGSGGMFVQSARFVAEHQKDPNAMLSVYGQERVDESVRLCKMNLAVHNLAGDIREGNTYYEDLHESATKKGKPGKFDFVMANPPFNVDKVDKERLADDPRFPYGLPRTDNANYIWIQQFASALNKKGRAGFVMANSAADARSSEAEIRRQMIEDHLLDVMVAVGPNFFYTVTLPCTLWFLDRAKSTDAKHPNREKVLFIDARNLFRQIDRAHRDWTPEQIEFLANIVRLYRGNDVETRQGSEDLMAESFPDGTYADVAGLCKVATLKEIEEQGWSLNPGRYVGVADREEDDFVFSERLEELNEELTVLNSEASELEERIANNVAKLLEEAS